MTLGELKVLLKVDDTGLNEGQRSINRFTSAATSGFGRVAAGLGIFTTGALVLRKFVSQTSEAQDAMAQLSAVIKSTGGAAGRTSRELADLAKRIQATTTFSDSAATSALALLLTFDKINGNTLDKAAFAAANLAARIGGDLSSAALQVGRALQEPAEGITQLQRQFRLFNEAQVETLKRLVETGRVAEAQKIILDALAVKFGGAAEAARGTLGGALKGLANDFGSLFEASSNATRPIVAFINAMGSGLRALKEWNRDVQTVAVALGTAGLLGILVKLAPAISALSFRLGITSAFAAAAVAGTGFKGVLVGLVGAFKSLYAQSGLSMALFRTGIPSAFAAAGVAGTGLRGIITGLTASFRLLLVALAPVLAVLGTIAGVVGLFRLGTMDANAALRNQADATEKVREEMEKYKASIAGLSGTQLRYKIQDVEAALRALPKPSLFTGGGKINPAFNASLAESVKLQAELLALREELAGRTLDVGGRSKLLVDAEEELALLKEKVAFAEKNRGIIKQTAEEQRKLDRIIKAATQTGVERLSEDLDKASLAAGLLENRLKPSVALWDETERIINAANTALEKQSGLLTEERIQLAQIRRDAEALKESLIIPDSVVTKLGLSFSQMLAKMPKVGLMGTGPASVTGARNIGLDAQLGQIRELEAALIDTRFKLDAAISTGSTALAKAVQEDMDSLVARARAAGAQVLQALLSGTLSKADTTALRAALEGLLPLLTAPTDAASKFEAQLSALQQSGQTALAAISNGFNNLDDSINRTIRSTLSLLSNLLLVGDSLKRIKAEQKAAEAKGGSTIGSLASLLSLAGGVVGAVGSFAAAAQSLGQALFGMTQHQRELIEALKSNAERIERASLEVAGALRGAQNVGAARSASAALAPIVNALFKNKDFLGSSRTAQNAQINDLLAEFGLNLSQLNAIAQDNGIQLLDSSGRVLAGSFEQLAEMLGFTLKALTEWGKGLDAQRQRLDLRNLVNNVTDTPLLALQRELDLIRGADSPLSVFFAGIDATSKEGQARFRQSLNSILDIIDAGGIAPFLGKLQGLDELTPIIRNMANALNEMDSATRSLTEALTNVPSGFRVAAHRFDASDPVTSSLFPPVGALPGTVTINIQQREGESSEELARRVVEVIQHNNRRTRGSPISASLN